MFSKSPGGMSWRSQWCTQWSSCLCPRTRTLPEHVLALLGLFVRNVLRFQTHSRCLTNVPSGNEWPPKIRQVWSLVSQPSLALLGSVRTNFEDSWNETFFYTIQTLSTRRHNEQYPLAVSLQQLSLRGTQPSTLSSRPQELLFLHFPKWNSSTERLALFKVRGRTERQKGSEPQVPVLRAAVCKWCMLGLHNNSLRPGIS